MDHAKAVEHLTRAGWGIGVANFGASMLDPVTNLAWFGLGGPVSRVAMMAGIGRRVSGMVGNAIGGIGATAVEDLVGKPTEPSQYLEMAGMGLVWGALFEPVAKHPQEAAVLNKVGEQLQQEAVAQAVKPIEKALTQAAVSRAEADMSLHSFRKELQEKLDQIGFKLTLKEDHWTDQPGASEKLDEIAKGSLDWRDPEHPVAQAAQDISDALQGKPVDVVQSVQKAVESITAPPMEAPKAAPEKEPGLLQTAPEVAHKRIDAELPKAPLRDRVLDAYSKATGGKFNTRGLLRRRG